MDDQVVRHNQDSHRVVTNCDCGVTISLPDCGESYERCPCGRVWQCDGLRLGMYVPRDWYPEQER